jgi:hypothetical protein
VARNAKRWRERDQSLRGTATGLLEAEKKFRRIKGYHETQWLKERLNPSRIQQSSSGPLTGNSPDEMKRKCDAGRGKEFAAHVCVRRSISRDPNTA